MATARYVPPLAIIAAIVVPCVSWICIWHFKLYPPVGTYVGILGFLAVVVTLWPPEKRWNKVCWVILFFFMMFFEIRNLYRDRAEHDSDQAQIRKQESDRFGKIVGGLETAITQSQQQFKETIGGLDKSVKSVIGGDSFCMVSFYAMVNNEAHLEVSQRGEYPVRELIARVFDVAAYIDWINKHGSPQAGDVYPGEALYKLGTMPVHASTPLGKYDLSPTGAQNFQASFVALNGYWIEDIRLRRVNNKWFQALRVSRQDITEEMRGGIMYNVVKPRVRFEKIDPGYPLVKGKVDWNSFE